MFNLIITEFDTFKLIFLSFFVIITVRKFLFKRPIYVASYLIVIVVFIFVAISGTVVINDDYRRLKQFQILEESNQLQDAKLNPDKYDRLLQFDLKQFKTI